MRRLFAALALICLAALPVKATEAGWALLREGGHVVLLRHAYAPGASEPANFDIANCRTQRPLSDRGRQQARKIGALFAARADTVGKVLTSRYCRCIETAELAFGARLVEQLDALDPAAPGSPEETAHKDALLELVRNYSDSENLVLVTHDETIAALTGQHVREGEAVIVVPNETGLHVAGRIIFN